MIRPDGTQIASRVTERSRYRTTVGLAGDHDPVRRRTDRGRDLTRTPTNGNHCRAHKRQSLSGPQTAVTVGPQTAITVGPTNGNHCRAHKRQSLSGPQTAVTVGPQTAVTVGPQTAITVGPTNGSHRRAHKRRSPSVHKRRSLSGPQTAVTVGPQTAVVIGVLRTRRSIGARTNGAVAIEPSLWASRSTPIPYGPSSASRTSTQR